MSMLQYATLEAEQLFEAETTMIPQLNQNANAALNLAQELHKYIMEIEDNIGECHKMLWVKKVEAHSSIKPTYSKKRGSKLVVYVTKIKESEIAKPLQKPVSNKKNEKDASDNEQPKDQKKIGDGKVPGSNLAHASNQVKEAVSSNSAPLPNSNNQQQQNKIKTPRKLDFIMKNCKFCSVNINESKAYQKGISNSIKIKVHNCDAIKYILQMNYKKSYLVDNFEAIGDEADVKRAIDISTASKHSSAILESSASSKKIDPEIKPENNTKKDLQTVFEACEDLFSYTGKLDIRQIILERIHSFLKLLGIQIT